MKIVRAIRTFATLHFISMMIVLVALLWSYMLPVSVNSLETASNGLMLVGFAGSAGAFLTTSLVLLQWVLEARRPKPPQENSNSDGTDGPPKAVAAAIEAEARAK